MAISAVISGPFQRPDPPVGVAQQRRIVPGAPADAARRPDTSGERLPGAAAASVRPVAAIQAPLLSAETQRTAQEARRGAAGSSSSGGDDDGTRAAAAARADNPQELTPEEEKKVRELQQRDREVRAHEQAHKTVGGIYAGNPTYKTVRGPDGRSYAVSGEVKIDTSPVPNNPEATIRKMEQVKRAALAPTNPSAQDRRVASEAEAKIQKARQEKRQQDAEELEKSGGNERNGPGSAANNSGAPRADVDALARRIAEQSASGSAIRPGTRLNLVA